MHNEYMYNLYIVQPLPGLLEEQNKNRAYVEEELENPGVVEKFRKNLGKINLEI